jgi:uncharacterized protein YodC (DUF2158 family)
VLRTRKEAPCSGGGTKLVVSHASRTVSLAFSYSCLWYTRTSPKRRYLAKVMSTSIFMDTVAWRLKPLLQLFGLIWFYIRLYNFSYHFILRKLISDGRHVPEVYQSECVSVIPVQCTHIMCTVYWHTFATPLSSNSSHLNNATAVPDHLCINRQLDTWTAILSVIFKKRGTQGRRRSPAQNSSVYWNL